MWQWKDLYIGIQEAYAYWPITTLPSTLTTKTSPKESVASSLFDITYVIMTNKNNLTKENEWTKG